jgi:hypothetical protein
VTALNVSKLEAMRILEFVFFEVDVFLTGFGVPLIRIE